MLDAYHKVLAATAAEQKDAYEATASQIGTRGEFAEKDFWVCLTLELLFGATKPACGLTFKGGTSLSKAFGLVQRFSEDIDVVLAPEGLGGDAYDAAALAKLSRKQQSKAFDLLLDRASAYVGGPLKNHIETGMRQVGVDGVVVTVSSEDAQTLLISYPTVYGGVPDYIHPAVRVECGPRSARVPSAECEVKPYIGGVLEGLDLTVKAVSTICAERTFWEKAFILHGHHCRFRDEEVIPVERNRLSRHYYDVAMLHDSPIGDGALADQGLMAHVREHNQLAFPGAWRKYDEGKPGSFLILPQPQVKKAIEADYDQMQSMVFGDVPSFAWVHEQLEKLHARLNIGNA